MIIIMNITIPFHFPNPLPTYKYITSKQHSCAQGPLRVCRSIRSSSSGLPYYCTPPVCVPAQCTERASCVAA